MDEIVEKVDWLGKVDDALHEMVPATELYVETAAMMLWLDPVMKAMTVIVIFLMVLWVIRHFANLDKLGTENLEQFYKIRDLKEEIKEMTKVMDEWKDKAQERSQTIILLRKALEELRNGEPL